MNIGRSERLMFSVVMGFAIIMNLISSSYLEFYPTSLLVGAAFATGIIMVIGSAYVMLKEPERLIRVRNPDIIALKRPAAFGNASASAC